MSVRNKIAQLLFSEGGSRHAGLAHDESSPTPVAQFQARCMDIEKPRVLELGVKRSIPDRSTMHRKFVPHASEYVGTDVEEGVDVDFACDIHHLSRVTGCESYDAIISCSTFEHFKYPHVAAHEIMKTLRVGGLLFVQTHQCFPIHAHPYDYFRFYREALAGLFGTRMGVDVISTNYEFPSHIFSKQEPGTNYHPAFLNVTLFAEKTAPTPNEYIVELDCV